MACFCRIPMETAPAALASMKFNFTPPTIPLQMNAALALGGGSMRLDMAISAWMQSIKIPSIMLNGGLMAQLNIAMGMFDLFDLPSLEAQLALGAQSLTTNAWPALQFLASLNLSAVLRLAMIARLQLALDALQINLGAGMPPPTSSIALNAKFALTPPQITLGHMMLGIPVALALSAKLGVPVTQMGSHFHALAKIKPPSIGISMPSILKICMALNAIATIKAAFGLDAMTGAGLAKIAATLRLYAALPMPDIPLPPLALAMKLDGLPSLPDLQAGAGAIPPGGLHLSLPMIPILPHLTLMATLAATINLNFPGGPCGPGQCAFG